MDESNYSMEYRKGQHLFAEEWHETEIRLKDGWSLYKIAHKLKRPYNTIKNEVRRESVLLYAGKVSRRGTLQGKARCQPQAVEASGGRQVLQICGVALCRGSISLRKSFLYAALFR